MQVGQTENKFQRFARNFLQKCLPTLTWNHAGPSSCDTVVASCNRTAWCVLCGCVQRATLPAPRWLCLCRSWGEFCLPMKFWFVYFTLMLMITCWQTWPVLCEECRSTFSQFCTCLFREYETVIFHFTAAAVLWSPGTCMLNDYKQPSNFINEHMHALNNLCHDYMWNVIISKLFQRASTSVSPKSSKSVNFWQSYLKNKKVDVFGTQCSFISARGNLP